MSQSKRRLNKANKFCDEPECRRKFFALGKCKNHYNKLPHQKESRRKYEERTREEKRAYYKRTSCKPNVRFVHAKSGAKQRGLEWSLPFEWYEILISALCTYCTGPIGTTAIGLDRIDNTKGYTKENCFACCTECNRLRGRWTSVEEMHEIVKLLYKMRKVPQGELWAHVDRAVGKRKRKER